MNIITAPKHITDRCIVDVEEYNKEIYINKISDEIYYFYNSGANYNGPPVRMMNVS